MDKPAAFGASAGARANSTGLASFLDAFARDSITDTKQQKMYKGPFSFLSNDTLELYLLKNWYTGHRAYDALFINSLSNSTQVSQLCNMLNFAQDGVDSKHGPDWNQHTR